MPSPSHPHAIYFVNAHERRGPFDGYLDPETGHIILQKGDGSERPEHGTLVHVHAAQSDVWSYRVKRVNDLTQAWQVECEPE